MGEARNLNFMTATEQSRQTINNWVEDKTNNKIKDLIPAGALDSTVRFVLTNAVYFKGRWVKQFEEADTTDEDFMINENETVTVPMMSRTDDNAEFNYAETENLQVLELLYQGEDLSMIVLLPKTNNLSSVEDSLTVENLNEWRSQLVEQRVNVFIPKFTFETKYFLSQNLISMGMPTAFTPSADFSGMDGTTNLYIASVIHQAFVEVNEEGTEAAAATAVIGVMGSAPSLTKIFRADHPFIFIIQERSTGNILFLGRVVNPT
jgi:serpin B